MCTERIPLSDRGILSKDLFVSQVMQTSWKELLNSIAGTMGLYLGYSYLCALYIVDILIRGFIEIASWANFKRKQKRAKNGKKSLRNLVNHGRFR